jgi:hypothetical protein
MRVLTLPLVALAACQPGVSTAPAPALPAAVSLVPDTGHYALAEHRHVEQTIQGQPIVADVVARFGLTLSLAPADDGLTVAVRLDSATIGDGAGGEAYGSELAGARITGHLGPSSARFTREDDAAAHEVLDQLTLSLHDLLPALPAGGARPGATWADTTTVTGRAAGMPVTVAVRAASQAGSWEHQDDVPVLGVARLATYTLHGEGDPTGGWIVLRGHGVQHARSWLDTAGVVRRVVRADTLRAEIELTGTGLVIPVIQARADTLRRVIP